MLSVIIPAYNDERHIKETIKAVYGYLFSHGLDHEIIVVTDGSKDRTPEIVESLTAEVPTLFLIKHEKNRGKGFVVKTGMLKAKGDLRLFMDADNATTIDTLEIMKPYFSQGYDVVIASIALKGADIASGSEPIWRQLFGKLGNLYIQILAVPGIQDTQRGFKVFSARAADNIFPKLKIDRFAFDVEVLALARKLGYAIKEVPIKWKNDPKSASRPRLKAYFGFLFEVLKIRWNLWTGVYADRKV